MTFLLSPLTQKKYEHARTILSELNIRHTKKRADLLAIIYGDGSQDIHFTIDDLVQIIKKHRMDISLATLYNTLRVLVDKGRLSEVTLPMGGRIFDTDTSSHQHFYNLDTLKVSDIPQKLSFEQHFDLPKGTAISDVKVTICLKNI
jgi:Fur family iron response transcriptional regulator